MKWRILFVDDESEALRALEQALAAMRGDWELVFASSGAQALELLALEPCHVILADMHMPGMNGAELLKEVCQRYPNTIRFIVSTAADREFISQFSGDTHQFLAKPCDTETLISTLERTLAVDWRGVLPGRPMPSAAAAAQPATNLDESEAATPAGAPSAAGPRPKSNRLPWLIAPAFALVLLLLAGWWWTRGLSPGPQPVAAREGDAGDAGTKAEAAAEASPAPVDAAVVAANPASDPHGAAGPGEVNVVKPGVDGLKLQGVFFSKSKPAALINGKAVYRGELIQGVKVVAIARDGVTLEFEGKKTELKLR
jgi:CheY-like chemotaxis protein